MLVSSVIVQRVQKWLGLRQSGDPDDQHLKQDIRSIGEDLKDKQSPRHEDGTMLDARIAKKQMNKGLDREDRTLPRRHRMCSIVAHATTVRDRSERS